jgi:hypothetical protein
MEDTIPCSAKCGRNGEEHSHRGKPWCGDPKCYHEINRRILQEAREDAGLTDIPSLSHRHHVSVGTAMRPLTERDRAELTLLLRKIQLESATCAHAKEIQALAIEALTITGGAR